MTQEGYDRLSAELDDLKTNGRKAAAKAIAEAREKGDLSENAEYDAAKDAQGMLEMKISELDAQLANARVLDASELDTSEVRVLSSVRIKNVKTGKEITYTLVSAAEADLKAKKISVTSPVGEALIGKKVGEIAQVNTPRGAVDFEVMEITIG